MFNEFVIVFSWIIMYIINKAMVLIWHLFRKTIIKKPDGFSSWTSRKPMAWNIMDRKHSFSETYNSRDICSGCIWPSDVVQGKLTRSWGNTVFSFYWNYCDFNCVNFLCKSALHILSIVITHISHSVCVCVSVCIW